MLRAVEALCGVRSVGALTASVLPRVGLIVSRLLDGDSGDWPRQNHTDPTKNVAMGLSV